MEQKENDVLKPIFDDLFSLPKNDSKKPEEKPKFNPYDWDNPDNCSDREYMDDEDYDDFDN